MSLLNPNSINAVRVVALKDGSIVGVSQSNPDYGFIRVEQENVVVVNNWLKRKKLSAVINGLVKDLKELKLYAGVSIPGKLVVKESLEPFNPGPYQDRDIKHAFEGGPICVHHDQPIYRVTQHTYNMEEYDELIPHTNVEEIKEASAVRRAALAIVSENQQNESVEDVVEEPTTEATQEILENNPIATL